MLETLMQFLAMFLARLVRRSSSILFGIQQHDRLLGEEESEEEEEVDVLAFHSEGFADPDIVRHVCWQSGEITRVETDYVMVSDKYFWPKELKISDLGLARQLRESSLQKERKVKCKLERSGEHEEWKVIDVQDEHENEVWEDDNQLPSWLAQDDFDGENIVTAVVEEIDFKKQKVILSSSGGGDGSTFNIVCDLGDLNLAFTPWKGDCLTVKVECKMAKADSVKVLSAQPLRYYNGTHEVSFWNYHKSFGTIDGQVFFAKDSCANSYQPRKEDFVRYHAIECDPCAVNMNFSWRAIRVIPAPSSRSNKRQMNFESTNQIHETLTKLFEANGGLRSERYMKLPQMHLGEVRAVHIDVDNENESPALLLEVKILGLKRGEEATNRVKFNGSLPFILPATSKFSLPLKFKAGLLGYSKECVVFTFEGNVQVASEVEFSVSDPSLQQFLTPNGGSGSRFERRNNFSDRQSSVSSVIIKGQKKVNKTRFFIPSRLGNYDIPKIMWDRFQEENSSIMLDYPVIEEPLFYKNYKAKFSALLHLEEMSSIMRISQFEMREAVFHSVGGEYLSLKVPGLAEKRPSLMLGDAIIATASRTLKSRPVSYEGVIHEVLSSSVVVKFHQTFHDSYCGEVYDVTFKLNRGPFRRQHQAVEMCSAYLGEDILFPKTVKICPPQVNVKVKSKCNVRPCPPERAKKPPLRIHSSLYPIPKPLKTNETSCGFVTPSMNPKSCQAKMNEFIAGYGKKVIPVEVPSYFGRGGGDSLSLPAYTKNRISTKGNSIRWVKKDLNREQKLAVKRILLGEARPLPYIIYGPPGTGKTVTLVEAILQIYLMRPESRLLVSAPTNSSADLILQRLVAAKKIPRAHLARLNAFQRNVDVISDDLKGYCVANSDPLVLRDVLKKRVLITTCTTAGQLHKMNVQGSQFTHCFLDEAGHTTEPEALLPIGLVSRGNCQIVLAGDPKQLGPVLQSNVAKLYGLEESLLERMCGLKLYSRDDVRFKHNAGYDPVLVTKLLKNYRSHMSIIQIPSKLFYDGELQVCADVEKRNRFLNIPFLPNNKHPIVFNGVKGRTYQEEDSPSWFNPVEAFQVVTYLKKLYNAGIEPDDVGIIAPYRKQSAKIRELMNSFDLSTDNLKIGSVEEFQGQERPVIILTTVRSSITGEENSVAFDVLHGLGFMQSEKRMNVALTRAQSLLIICGDPHVLQHDESWKTFLKFCCANECYTGCDLPSCFM